MSHYRGPLAAGEVVRGRVFAHKLEDLEQIRALVPDDTEELVMDVMDLLTGWCATASKPTPYRENESGSSV
jgi:hypothetical protein